MSKILLSLLSLVMITVMAGCSAPDGGAGAGDGAEPAGRHDDDADAPEAAPAPEVVPAPEAAPAPAPEAAPAPAADGAAPEAAPAPSASAAPLTGTKWA